MVIRERKYKRKIILPRLANVLNLTGYRRIAVFLDKHPTLKFGLFGVFWAIKQQVIELIHFWQLFKIGNRTFHKYAHPFTNLLSAYFYCILSCLMGGNRIRFTHFTPRKKNKIKIKTLTKITSINENFTGWKKVELGTFNTIPW